MGFIAPTTFLLTKLEDDFLVSKDTRVCFQVRKESVQYGVRGYYGSNLCCYLSPWLSELTTGNKMNYETNIIIIIITPKNN